MKGIRKYLNSIRFRMLALYLGIVIVLFVGMFLVSLNVVEVSLIDSKVKATLNKLNSISYSLTQYIDRFDMDTINNEIVKYAQTEGGRVLVLSKDYMVAADSSSMYNGYYLPYDEAVEVIENGKDSSYGFHRLDNPNNRQKEWLAYFAKPISANGFNKGVLLLSVSIQQTRNVINEVQSSMLVTFLIALLITSCVWLLVVSNMVRPITKLTNIMRNANAKTFEKRVDIKASGEVAELVDAFNRMGSELNSHDKIRDRFVADASHELKTPLAAIKALSESMIYAENPPVELVLDFMKDINEQVDRLNNIVQDLLQVARDSSMDVQYNMEELNFSEITYKIANLLTPVAEKKGLTLTMQVDENIEIFGDKMRMERVITNLVDNAIKYTEKGSVEVRLKRERREAVLTVKDTGIGIDEESIPRLFVRFYRVDKARSRATGGTGLGLSMVEEIVSRHSGTIKVESQVGVGSEFIVRIPLMSN